MKKVAGLTITKDDPLLHKWLKYYSPFFDHIVVLDQGERLSAVLPCGTYGAERLALPCDATGQSRWRYNISQVNEFCHELLDEYDTVFFADADEYVFADPVIFNDLRDYIERLEKPFVYSQGYDVAGDPKTQIDWTAPVLQQLDGWCENHLYGKPHILQSKFMLSEGGHYLVGNTRAAGVIDKRLYTAHLFVADLDMARIRFGNSYNVSDDEIINHMNFRQEHGVMIPDRFREVGI